MQATRGFISIPIIIFIALATLIGGSGAIAIQQNAENKAEEVELDIIKIEEKVSQIKQERALNLSTSTATPTPEANNLEEEGSNSQDRVGGLVAKEEAQQVEEPEEPVVLETAKAFSKPGESCLATTEKWDDFASELNDVEVEILNLISIVSEFAGNITEEIDQFLKYVYPSEAISKYKYSSLKAKSRSIYATADNLRLKISTMPPPTNSDTPSGNTYKEILDSLKTSVDEGEIYFELALSGYEALATPEGGPSFDETKGAFLVLNEARTSSRKVDAEGTRRNGLLTDLMSQLNKENNYSECVYTFDSKNLVYTTAQEEKDFLNLKPKVTRDKEQSEWVVEIYTPLPTRITDPTKGDTEAMFLQCKRGYADETYSVSAHKTDLGGKSKIIRARFSGRVNSGSNIRICQFVYRGVTRLLKTEKVEFQ